MKSIILKLRCWIAAALLCCAPSAPAFLLYEGDGSDEPGFVPPEIGKAPPPPPAQVSSAETYVPYPPPPVVPQARSEKKKPPKPPVLYTKLTSPHGQLDWNTRPNDLNNLLKSMKGMIDVNFSMDVKPLSAVDVNSEKNPILYRSGHFHFSWSPGERKRVRSLLLNGGMIVMNAGLGSKPFYDSARAELREIFPEAPIKRLGPDHPLFQAYYDVSTVEYCSGVRETGYLESEPWIEGVELNCRLIAVLSRWDMAVGWEGDAQRTYRAYKPDSAMKLGVNMMAYAAAQRAWVQSIAKSMEYTDTDERRGGKVQIAQIMYGGEWKTRHAALSMLLHRFHQKTEVPVRFEKTEIRLSDPALSDIPLIYMTGHEDFKLDAKETQSLRGYLERGGLLVAEACCGRQGFGVAFKREIRKVLPRDTLRKIPAGDMMFAFPNLLQKVEVTPALAAANSGGSTIEPELQGIQKQGNYVVLFSPYGLSGGWEMSQCPYSFGYQNADALRVGENILMHALTH